MGPTGSSPASLPSASGPRWGSHQQRGKSWGRRHGCSLRSLGCGRCSGRQDQCYAHGQREAETVAECRREGIPSEDALLLAVPSLFSFIIFRLMKVKVDGDLLNCSCKGEGFFFISLRQGLCICRQDWPPTRSCPSSAADNSFDDTLRSDSFSWSCYLYELYRH